MDGDNDQHVVGLTPLTVAMISIICAAAVLLTYHIVMARYSNHEDADNHQRDAQRLPVDTRRSSVENSIAELIPSYKYTKEISLVTKTQDSDTCSVCLCEFVDGDPVRVLPECLHPFHVTCIDTWLLTQSSCPLCRAGTPTPPQWHAAGRRCWSRLGYPWSGTKAGRFFRLVLICWLGLAYVL